MSELEIVAVVLGVANILLIIRRSVWNYPVGIAMVILYAFVFWEVKLYSDALLQGFFLVAQLYGWAAWRNAAADAGEVRVEVLDTRGRILWSGGAVAAALIWGWGMHRFTDAALPYWDALVAMPSVAAQLLLARRKLENWLLWIAVDIVAIGLYWTKGLALTAGLYAGFLVLATIGLVQWWRVWRAA